MRNYSSYRHFLSLLLVTLSVISLVGCAGASAKSSKSYSGAPVASLTKRTQGIHTVKAGESLSRIAARYGWDTADLAQANRIAKNEILLPGQKLHFKAAKSRPRVIARHRASTKAAAPLIAKVEPRQSFKAQDIKNSKQVAAKKAKPVVVAKNTTVAKKPSVKKSSVSHKSTASNKNSQWQWPTKGTVIAQYSPSKDEQNQGIDIKARAGTPIYAAADGHVVYSGSGLRGYGQLVIIKHKNNYLTAYAHNRRLTVKEGDKIKVGQLIAEMGDSGAEQVKLHFQIRHHGKPVNPLRYLPTAQG